MKIAVCLAGHLRTFEKCHESLRKNVLDKYDCDVFISTWENRGNTLYHAHYQKGYDESDERVDMELVNSIYKPCEMIVENPLSEEIAAIKRPFTGMLSRNGANIENVVPMFYKMWNCNSLKRDYETKFDVKYDLTLRCRFDVYVKKVDAHLATEKIQFIPGHCGVNDIIFIGPNNAMNDALDLYTVLSPQIPFNQFENAENILMEHLLGNNIPFQCPTTAIDYLFVKPAGYHDCHGKKVLEFNQEP